MFSQLFLTYLKTTMALLLCTHCLLDRGCNSIPITYAYDYTEIKQKLQDFQKLLISLYDFNSRSIMLGFCERKQNINKTVFENISIAELMSYQKHCTVTKLLTGVDKHRRENFYL